MRALVATAPGRVEVGDVAVPELGRDQIMVRTRVSAVSAGTERRKIYTEQLGPRDLRDPWPVVGAFGYMAAGVVEEVGPDAGGAFRPGDRVYCGRTWGGHRELIDVSPAAVLPLPDEIGFLDGACSYWAVPPLLGLLAAEPIYFEDAAVIGLGPLGLCAVQLLAPISRRLVAIDPVPARRLLAERLGATSSVDPGAGPAAVRELVRSMQPGLPDVVLEVSGTQGGLETALEIVRPKGRVALVGSQKLLDGFDLFWPLQHSGARIVPLHRPGTDSPQQPGAGNPVHRYLPDVFELIARGRLDLRPLITWSVPPDDGPRAIELVHRRPDLGVGLALAWDPAEIRALDEFRSAASRAGIEAQAPGTPARE